VNIIEALDSPDAFGALLRDPATWAAWRVFLCALFGLEMADEQSAIYTACTGRQELPTTPASEAWLVIGRRGGKSFVLALVAVFLASYRDWRPHLGPGERATVVVIAADRRQARTIMRYAKGILSAVPMLAATVEATRQEAIDLDTSVTIEVHTASFRTVRGYTIVAALLDELAFWQGEDSANPDHEIITAIRPAMATIPDALLLCASSPYARRGALWETYHRYFGQAGPVLVWQAATRVMNPTVSQAFIDAEMEKDPVSAAAEFGGEFRTDVEGFVSRQAVEAVTDWGEQERAPLRSITYSAFTDPSGGSSDAFTLAVAHVENGIGILDCLREVRPPFSPEGVVQEFADLLKSYRVTRVQGDRYAGLWPTEQFAKRGIKYEPSEDPKGILYLNLLPHINSGKVRLLGNKRLVTQLIGLERRTSRAGRDSIDHAPGGHDDVANAVAGALLAATAKKPKMRFGTIDFAKTGKVTWHDAEPERPRLRVVTITEQEDLRQRGLL
jgi:hypothetical protein